MNLTGCQPFDEWCALRNVQPLGAAPSIVAQFVAHAAPFGIEQAWELVTAISRAHYLIGLADPTLGGPVSVALNAIAKIEAPRSWPKEHKFRFATLPYDLQLYVAAHEAQRDRTVRQAQNDAALARQGKPPAKAKDGTPATAAA